MKPPFLHRPDAGKRLAPLLAQYAGRPNVIALGLPRGGVAVAFEVAAALHAPLDVFVVRRLGVPGREELAMGAVASGGVRVLNHELIDELQLSAEVVEPVVTREAREVKRRETLYRGHWPTPDVREHTTIVVDDGNASGLAISAAVIALRHAGAAKIVVAAPLISAAKAAELRPDVDELVALFSPVYSDDAADYYEDFPPISDWHVRELLRTRVGTAPGSLTHVAREPRIRHVAGTRTAEKVRR